MREPCTVPRVSRGVSAWYWDQTGNKEVFLTDSEIDAVIEEDDEKFKDLGTWRFGWSN